jgi:uncharacterized membrane protein
MDRKEIKELAKKKISGNKWNILWPLLIISVISSILNSFFGPSIDFAQVEELGEVNMSMGSSIGSLAVSIVMGVISAGYMKYILNFVRTDKFNTEDIINTIKAKWVDLLIAIALYTIIVAVGSMLLVIPGIIASLGLAMAVFLVIDKDVKGQDSLKASWTMMKGHKWEYFVFGLSFIGWILLVPFTLGILLIWLVPYMTVARTIYYDRLVAKKD